MGEGVPKLKGVGEVASSGGLYRGVSGRRGCLSRIVWPISDMPLPYQYHSYVKKPNRLVLQLLRKEHSLSKYCDVI